MDNETAEFLRVLTVIAEELSEIRQTLGWMRDDMREGRINFAVASERIARKL